MEKYKKGKICIRLLILCITCLLSLNLYSNTNAVTLTTDVTPTGKIWNTPSLSCKYIDGTTINRNDNTCDITSDQINVNNISSIVTRSTLNMKKNYYYTALISIKSPYNDVDSMPYMLWNAYTSNSNYHIIEIKEITNDAAQTDISYILDSECTRTSYLTGRWWCEKTNDVIYIKFYEITLQNIKDNGSYNWWLGTSNRELFYSGGSAYINAVPFVTLYNITEYASNNSKEEEAQKELEDRDNLETQSTETNSDANSSSQDIGTATTSITGVISAFVGNLQNLNANNCTLPEITAYGFSLGQLDLCTFSPPSWIAGITNVIVSLITLGLAYHLFRRIMGIAKSMAGGK